MHRSLVLVLCLASPALSAEPASTREQTEFFEKQVRPLLVEKCQQCHGPDKARGGLRLDSRDAVLKGGDSGPALVVGKPDESRLLQAVRHADMVKMPPKEKLADDRIAALAAWVKMGAPWPGAAEVRPVAGATGFQVTDKDRDFWAFRPVREPVVPEVGDIAWPRRPIDRFLLARLEQEGLRPAPPADNRALLRRLTFDLTGLPPTPEEMDAFLESAIRNPQSAIEEVVDRLLASPAYGERWGRHWLDVARYGEDQAHTFEARKYPDGFRYRDWVVQALNADMPYDRFVVAQLAGDLTADGDRVDRQAALGYFALGPVYYGKAIADELDDRIDTLSRGFLGLTVACARCHDHKFDPIGQKDYFALAGVFASTDYKEYVLTAEGTIDDTQTSEPTDKNKDKNKPRKPVLHSLTEGKPTDMRIHLRGNPNNPGDEAPRRFLSVLTSPDAPRFTQGSGRLELARAIASPDNPLTARVIVNRVWGWHFGRGLVGTPSNFGHLGERPSHPELLDYLAARFVANGWSLKWLHREIVLSAAYQQSSNPQSAIRNPQSEDPDNRLLWRMNRKRLEVEPWRDAMLAVAGNLDRTAGGPPADLSNPGHRRRTLYGAVSRHNLDPLLRLFDFPDPNVPGDSRAVTTVPLQQLFVLNSDFMLAQAKALAARVASHPDDAARIRQAFELAYGRPATAAETRLGLKFLAGAAVPGGKLTAWEKYAQVLLASNEFAFID